MSKQKIQFSLVYRDMWQSSGKYVPRIDQLKRIAPVIIDMGCFSRIETNGGAFEQVNLLYGENPNQVVREWVKPFNEAGIQTHMLERALNGIRMFPVPSDVRKLMYKVKKAQGVDIARSFCGLNDYRNLELSVKYAKEAGMISQVALSITHSPVHTIEHYMGVVNKAVEFGTDEICLKDMAGVGRPVFLGKLVSEIKRNHPHIKVQYHGHSGPGLSMASTLEVAKAGADYIDVAMEPLSWGMVHPDLISVREMLHDAGFDVPDINMNAYMEARRLNQEFIDEWLGLFIDPKNRYMSSLLLGCGLPGGMMGSMMADLRGVLDGINNTLKNAGKPTLTQDQMLVKLFDEVAYVWPKLGYPPLVTPFSQYVKNVALINVMFLLQGKERYQMIDKNTWDMILGKAGNLPGPLAPEIVELAKKQNYEFYQGTPQEAYPDELDKYRKQMSDNSWDVGQDEEELFELAMHERQYLDYKSGIAKKRFEEEVEKARQQQNQSHVSVAPAPSIKTKEEKPVQNLPNDEFHKQLVAPIKGQVVFGFHEIIEEKFVKIGDAVKKGERICYIYSDLFQGFEEVIAPEEGVITNITVKQGSLVKKGEIIAVIKINQSIEAEKKYKNHNIVSMNAKIISDLEKLGITNVKELYYNLSYDELFKHETDEKLSGYEKGYVTNLGAVTVDTGIFTGRSPKDKYIVKDDETKDKIWWAGAGKKGSDNKSLDREQWNYLLDLAKKQLSGKKIYVNDVYAGANENSRFKIRVITEIAWGSHFVKNMFIRPSEKELENFEPDFILYHACKTTNPRWKEMNMNSEVFVVFNLTEKMAVIGGSWYGGEIKKGIFTVMNYFLPLKGIAAMHCSANVGKNNDTALFFGLSGTGKTTLSTDPERMLIGDDEHGWDDEGVFNFEGGCYAKCINLNPEKEPDIYQAIKRDALLENVVFDEKTGFIDFSSDAKTENTRVSYPIYHIKNIVKPVSKGPHAQTIIFLSADAFGVLPPVALLSKDEAMYYFLSGYTAKLAGTERGIIEPMPTFSAAFGAAFLPLHPTVYAQVLAKKMDQHNTKAYLVNTGWIGGPYGIGKRIDIVATRNIIRAILNGSIEKAEIEKMPIFNLSIPKELAEIDTKLLNPRNAWSDVNAYDKQAEMLAAKFIENFKAFTDNEEGKRLSQFGPQLIHI